MTRLVAIDNNRHRKLKIDGKKAEQHGATVQMLPVVLAEFTHLAVQYPIVFSKNGDTGQFGCSILLGFTPGENLFWQNEGWQGLYLPLQLQRQPFFIGGQSLTRVDEPSSAAMVDYVICVDEDSPAVSEFEGEPLYTSAGDESAYFQRAKALLAALLHGEKATAQFIETLRAMALIQPMALAVEFANHEKTRLNGLYTIDQSAVENLANEQVLNLHKANFLQPIYTMIASAGQFYALIERKNQRDRA